MEGCSGSPVYASQRHMSASCTVAATQRTPASVIVGARTMRQDAASAGIRDAFRPASGPCHAGLHGCHRELEGHRRRRRERRIERRLRRAHPRVGTSRRPLRHRDREGRGRGARPRARHAVHRLERHHRRQRHLGRRGLARRRDHRRSEAEPRTDPHRARRRQRPHPEVDDAAAARGRAERGLRHRHEPLRRADGARAGGHRPSARAPLRVGHGARHLAAAVEARRARRGVDVERPRLHRRRARRHRVPAVVDGDDRDGADPRLGDGRTARR